MTTNNQLNSNFHQIAVADANGVVKGVSLTGQSTLGNIANITITGGSNGQVMTTDGSGNLSWTTVDTSNSNTANYANFAGQANTANTANAVAGANVTGTVANATYATTSGTADSVAGANVTGWVANANIANTATTAGTVTTAAQPNITSVGTLTSLDTSGDVLIGGNLTVNGTTTTVHSTEVAIDDKNLTLAANATTAAQANGGGITLNGASASILYASADDTWNFNKPIVGNLTGTAASANLATYATTANAVAGANVTGTVANATYATTAGTADSVAGANVTGTVANATYATTSGTADSVAGANVTGTVSSATTAGTVTTAAQPNITSVGTLASLTVSGNAQANTNWSVKGFTETVASSANTGTSIAPDAIAGTIYNYTANANFTFNGFTNPIAGQSMTVVITQDGTGSRTMTSTMKFVGGSKTLSTAAGAIDMICVVYTGTYYLASLTKGYA